MITHNDPHNNVRGRETHNNKSNNDNVSLSSQSGEQRQSACARSVTWSPQPHAAGSTSTPPRPTDCGGASTLPPYTGPAPPCTPAGDSSARSTTTTTTTAGMHAESNGLTSQDASMLSTINYVYDTEFKTPGSSCTTLQSDHFVNNNNNNGNNYNDNNDDEEDLYTLRRKLKAYWRLYREQERRGRCDIILEQILSLRCILAEEFNARVLLLPSYDVSMAQLEREGVEKLHRLLEETIWGFKRVMRRSLCEQTVEENDSSQFPDALQLTEKKQNIMKKPQHDEEEEMMTARKRTRSEEDYASLCASAGGERWLNKSEYMSCQSYDGCHAAGGGCGGGAADVFPPVYSRAPSYQAETFYDMKNSLNTYHVNRQGEDNMMPCIQQQQQSSSSLLSSLLLLLSSFPFARIFLFLPLGVFLRCLHLLQKAPELMKLTAFCAVGAVRRSVEGSISFIHEIHEKRTIELLFILTLAATIRCCRGCLNAVMFQFYMMFAACLHVISSFISTSKDVMRETTQAMMYSVLSAQMFAYEFFILFPLGCTVRLTHALRSMEKQIISLPHRCGVYASYLVVGAGATVAQKISRRIYPSKRSMNKST